jgi:hypothetical protein
MKNKHLKEEEKPIKKLTLKQYSLLTSLSRGASIGFLVFDPWVIPFDLTFQKLDHIFTSLYCSFGS